MMAIPSEAWVENQEDTSCPVCNAMMSYGRADRKVMKAGHRAWHKYMMDQLERAYRGHVIEMDDADRDAIYGS